LLERPAFRRCAMRWRCCTACAPLWHFWVNFARKVISDILLEAHPFHSCVHVELLNRRVG
jgi:hypothetical protein